jgi:hypothetical protein
MPVPPCFRCEPPPPCCSFLSFPSSLWPSAQVVLHCHGCDSETVGGGGAALGGDKSSSVSLDNITFNSFITPEESSLNGGGREGGWGARCAQGNGQEKDRRTAREARVGDVTVVCPGKLSSGYFCVLTLRRHDPDRSWHLAQREFLHLYS